MNKTILIYSILILVLLPNIASNGVGNEISKNLNGIIIEFGIFPKEPIVNELTTMSLIIHEESGGNLLAINNLWIRISKDNKVLFSSSDFRIKEGSSLLITYIFPEEGTYTIDIIAQHNERELKTSFNVSVVNSNKNIFSYISILTLIFILIIFIIYKKFKK